MKNQFIKIAGLLDPKKANELMHLLDELAGICEAGKEYDSESMLGYLMTMNLRRRFLGEGIKENLYEEANGISQIRLFDILIHQFPFVKYSQQMVNNILLNVLQQEREVCLTDIGIGLGTQMLHILEKAKAFNNLQKLTIIGIEPFENALHTAATQILNYKKQVPFELDFVEVQDYVEHVDIAALRIPHATHIVNASLALHHIKSGDDRDRVVKTIHSLQPAAFLLIEPNVDHFTNDLSVRMLNAYEHFIGIFRVIDRLDISNEDKNGLKLFFGRELEDILSKANDEDRFEKHEPVSAWLHRLRKNGFALSTAHLQTGTKEEMGVIIKPYPEGYVGFSEKDEIILSVMCAL